MKSFIVAVRLFIVLTLLTGVAYPLIITGIAQGIFPAAANGSLIKVNGKTVGSKLIGQAFDDPKYFWSRPSATSPAYNAASSSGSNLGPTNPALKEAVAGRVKALKDGDPSNTAAVPTDLVTASGSGLDPNISVAAADYQVQRVAKVRKMTPEAVRELVKKYTQGPQLGILGESVVNVLELNLALDGVGPNP